MNEQVAALFEEEFCPRCNGDMVMCLSGSHPQRGSTFTCSRCFLRGVWIQSSSVIRGRYGICATTKWDGFARKLTPAEVKLIEELTES